MQRNAQDTERRNSLMVPGNENTPLRNIEQFRAESDSESFLNVSRSLSEFPRSLIIPDSPRFELTSSSPFVFYSLLFPSLFFSILLIALEN